VFVLLTFRWTRGIELNFFRIVLLIDKLNCAWKKAGIKQAKIKPAFHSLPTKIITCSTGRAKEPHCPLQQRGLFRLFICKTNSQAFLKDWRR